MKRLAAALLSAGALMNFSVQVLHAEEPQLLCHRTANEDVPENTLDSLEQAALLGCNTVEIDLRRTQDGEIVLNHDGILERLTDGVGEVKDRDYLDLKELDLGSWMASRFAGMHIARFADALEIAKKYKIRLVLDIKDKAIDKEVLRILDEQQMLDHVQFGGEWSDIKALMPTAKSPGDGATWVQPGVTSHVVQENHRKGTFVVANFSANSHDMDIVSMRSAVAAGVDAINVDYPRLGADAVGRPVEEKLRIQIRKASAGESGARSDAILMLARYQGFPLQEHFLHWILDVDPRVSRAAAEALVSERPRPDPIILLKASQSPSATVRTNAVWALGALNAPLSLVIPLLSDKDPDVLQMALLCIARTTGEVSESTLLTLLSSEHQKVRGSAARALAAHYPATAVRAVSEQLDKEVAAERVLFDDRRRRVDPSFTQSEIATIMSSFRSQMEMVRALSSIQGDEATNELIRLALRPDKDFSQYNAIIASFQLWDRIGANPQPLIDALGADNEDLAGRAEWALTHGGEVVLPALRKTLESPNPAARMHAMHVLAYLADQGSLSELRTIAGYASPDATVAKWAIARIEDLHPTP